MVFGIMIFVV